MRPTEVIPSEWFAIPQAVARLSPCRSSEQFFAEVTMKE
jgi:hypothetical protein